MKLNDPTLIFLIFVSFKDFCLNPKGIYLLWQIQSLRAKILYLISFQVLTAAHCYSKVYKKGFKNENGDFELEYDYHRYNGRPVMKYWGVKKLSGHITPWRDSIDPPNWSEVYDGNLGHGNWNSDGFYRQVQKIIGLVSH